MFRVQPSGFRFWGLECKVQGWAFAGSMIVARRWSVEFARKPANNASIQRLSLDPNMKP